MPLNKVRGFVVMLIWVHALVLKVTVNPKEIKMLNIVPQTIVLDCAPGTPRPDTYIAGLVKGTPLEGLPEAHPDSTVSRFFGQWTWHFPNVSKEDWDKAKEVIRPRITQLYNMGAIRYGSW